MKKYLRYKKWYKAIKESGLFDVKYYLFTYPDVRQKGVDPIKHYIKFGADEGRNPSAEFDTAYYLNTYNDVKESGVNPLAHYILYGKEEGRKVIIEKLIKSIQKDGVVKTTAKIHTKIHAKINDLKKLKSNFIDFNQVNKFASLELYTEIKQNINQKSKKISQPNLIKINENDVEEILMSISFLKQTNPIISIVIPVYNAIEELAECLLSIQKYATVEYEIIIADDKSPDTRIEKVFKNNKSIRYYRNEKNLGFLLNVNNAIKKAKGKYIFLLNSDVQLLDDTVGILKQELINDPSAGIVGPKIIFPNGLLQEAGCVIDKDSNTKMLGLGENQKDKKYNFKRYVDYISGACLLFEKKLFDELDGFDESFAPAYAEDLDFCARVIRKGKKILYVPHTTIMHHLSISSNALSSDFKYYQSAVNKFKFNQKHSKFFKNYSQLKPIAFYLPQFHSLKQNSYWWGKNYTEWTAAASAKPQYKGHYQPHIPADLGFYNLTEPKSFEEQATLAKRYGLHGFCFYYYNFGDFELMEKALETFIESKADINFCLCWANENWTKTWDGLETNILLEQKANDESFFLKVLQDMERFIRDQRYIKIDGKPIILLYREALFENISIKLDIWRNYWKEKYDEELYICAVDSMERAGGNGADPLSLGFNAAVEFPAHHIETRAKLEDDEKLNVSDGFKGTLLNYSDVVEEICSRPHPGYKRIPGCFPAWDNTPRRGNMATIMKDAHPSAFQVFLEQKAEEALLLSGDERMIFINAWNEWGEGTHLEPDLFYGHTHLSLVEKLVKEF